MTFNRIDTLIIPLLGFILCAFLLLLASFDFCNADVYMYTDEDGTIHIVDSPKYLPKGAKRVSEKDDKKLRNLKEEISTKYPPNNEIEEALNATVKIGTLGTGFFISDDGYILTNKHVVKGSKEKIKEIEDALEIEYAKLRRSNEWLNNAKQILDRKEAELTISRTKIESGPQVGDRQFSVMLTNYAIAKGEYDRDLDKYRQEIKRNGEIKEKIDIISSKLEGIKSVGYKNVFKIFIVGGSELYAYIERLSDRYDLALLKLDGKYKTPFIKPLDSNQTITGMPVYAIGNPLNIGYSVTSGIVSGVKIRKNDNTPYIQTNAEINAGNSGGPLITQDGKVIGVITLSYVGLGVEGLNFAIPIDIAFKEFAGYLR